MVVYQRHVSRAEPQYVVSVRMYFYVTYISIFRFRPAAENVIREGVLRM